MIIKLKKFKTEIRTIEEIPDTFFNAIENAESFGDDLFPKWTRGVFGGTSLFKKFKAVYDKYKAIASKPERDKIINAYSCNIEDLCANVKGTSVIKLTDLHESIQEEVDVLFLHLYNSAINYHAFEAHVKDNLKDAIDLFIKDNGLEVCPFCGIESFLNLEGQKRIALDHWLYKDLFPMFAVNFDNLFPLGEYCNSRPAKGTKNILVDDKTKKRVKAFFPYSHNGVTTSFTYINEPSISGIKDLDWSFDIAPNYPSEQDIFDCWNSTLNISIRYNSYYKKNVFIMWESDYKRFIEEDHEVHHANNVNELKGNFKLWRASFPVRGRPGAILYRAFIANLVNNVSDAYLYGLCENFKRS